MTVGTMVFPGTRLRSKLEQLLPAGFWNGLGGFDHSRIELLAGLALQNGQDLGERARRAMRAGMHQTTRPYVTGDPPISS